MLSSYVDALLERNISWLASIPRLILNSNSLFLIIEAYLWIFLNQNGWETCSLVENISYLFVNINYFTYIFGRFETLSKFLELKHETAQTRNLFRNWNILRASPSAAFFDFHLFVLRIFNESGLTLMIYPWKIKKKVTETHKFSGVKLSIYGHFRDISRCPH